MGLTEFLLVVAVGGGILAVLFSTFKGAASEQDSESRRAGASGRAAGVSREQAALEERRQAAMNSLDEIEADYEAGNLSQADYESLRHRYEGEVAHLARQVSEMESAPDEPAADVETVLGGRSSWLTPAVGWTAGTVAFVALAWVVMSQALSPRSAGDTMTGSLPGRGVESSAGVPIADVDPERLAALEAMVAENPNDVEALVALGHLYLRLQRNDELAAVTQRALELDPDNPEALTHMGMLLFSMQHPEGVMPSFDRALAVDPDFPEALFLKGMVSFMRQDYAAAVGAWEHYLEVVPTEEVPPRLLPMLEMARANVGSANSQ